MSEADFLPLVAPVEAQSTHPIGKAILAHTGNRNLLKVESLEEIKGHG